MGIFPGDGLRIAAEMAGQSSDPAIGESGGYWQNMGPCAASGRLHVTTLKGLAPEAHPTGRFPRRYPACCYHGGYQQPQVTRTAPVPEFHTYNATLMNDRRYYACHRPTLPWFSVGSFLTSTHSIQVSEFHLRAIQIRKPSGLKPLIASRKKRVDGVRRRRNQCAHSANSSAHDFKRLDLRIVS